MAIHKGSAMQRFDYRSPRFSVDLPVEYTIEGPMTSARCVEISADGMTLETEQLLAEGASGTVRVRYRSRTLQLDVRVVHASDGVGGIAFVYKDEGERKAVAQLIVTLSESGGGAGTVRLI